MPSFSLEVLSEPRRDRALVTALLLWPA